MVVVPGDLAVALTLLAVLEGFRRIAPEEFVFTSRNNQWHVRILSLSIWFRRIGWLWLAPWQVTPRTFVCRTGSAFSSLRSGPAAVGDVRNSMAELRRRYRLLSTLVALQAAMILALLPLLALFGSATAIYSAVLATAMAGVAIAVCVWNDDRWNALKYAAYPPSSLFALADRTLHSLEGHDFAVIAAVLAPDRQVTELLRRTYRTACFGPESERRSRPAAEAMIRDLAVMRGIGELEITRDPAPSSEHVLSFCPCCEAEYVIPQGECGDCPGVSLQPFRSAATQHSSLCL